MKSHRVQKIAGKKQFDKYDLYRKAVQSPDGDVIFLKDCYEDLRKKKPFILREDFCGTFALSCEWVKLGSKMQAIGIDLDPEPIEYGRSKYLKKLSVFQQKRIEIKEQNVLLGPLPRADIVAAMNFSYLLFKKRETLKTYFANVLASLKKEGIFILDIFGGSLCHSPVEDRIAHRDFIYYWDQISFDPVSNEAQFYIHFRIKGKRKQERVFHYDWRLWSIPELRELLLEVGFIKTHIYWEGTTRSGGGDGHFTRTEHGESCQSWIAYILAET